MPGAVVRKWRQFHLSLDTLPAK